MGTLFVIILSTHFVTVRQQSFGKVMFSVVCVCLFTGRPWDPPDIFKHAQFGPDCTGTPDTFELVPYEVRTFWKWAVGILLECLPSVTVVAEKLCFHRCLSVHGGGEVHTPSWADTPAPQADGHCSGRYASYWNALLLLL